jgi:CubicO group peptidase (beta-lactamase class C family)
MIRRTLGATILMVALTTTRPAMAADVGAQLEPLAQRTMATGLTPGLSVAVIRGDRVVWQSGFGMADREARRPVTPETRFYIGSTSKALTGLAAARLAARGVLDLDAPIDRVLPEARFAEGVAADSITLRRCLTHTHGLQAQGPVTVRMTFTGEYTNAELFKALAGHAPARGGRAYAYSNLSYEIVGLALAPDVTRGWKEVVDREVFAPLGMKATTAYASKVPASMRAEPYDTGAQGLERLPQGKVDANMGPAGGHFSTAPDLARLVIAEMNQGRIDGRQAIEPAVIRETQRSQVVNERSFPPFERHGWGLGWDLGTYRGDTLIHRFGGFDGYRCHVSFEPGPRLGVVVLVNGGQSANSLPHALAAAIYDRLNGRDSVEARLATRLDAAIAADARQRESIAADLAKRAARPKTPVRPLVAYTGTYDHPLYGTVVVDDRDGRLVARMGVAESALEVLDLEKEVFRGEFIGGGRPMGTRFAEGGDRAAALQMIDVEFTRRP